MPVVSNNNQLTIDFEPGLTERFASLLACVRNGVYANRKPLKTIAADMDLSESDLSRKLSANLDDKRRFSVEDLERYLEETKDMTPIYYLVDKFLQDEERRQRRAMVELTKQLPDILALIKAAALAAQAQK